jgi:hypothetical protein
MKSKKLHAAVAVAAVAFVLGVVATPSGAQSIGTRVSVGQTTLVGKGAQVTVRLTFVCDPHLNVAFGDVAVNQVSGHKLAQGAGIFLNNFPGVPCTGRPEVINVTVPSGTSFAFKPGSATATADFNTFDPVAGVLATTTVGPSTVRITK